MELFIFPKCNFFLKSGTLCNFFYSTLHFLKRHSGIFHNLIARKFSLAFGYRFHSLIGFHLFSVEVLIILLW